MLHLIDIDYFVIYVYVKVTIHDQADLTRIFMFSVDMLPRDIYNSVYHIDGKVAQNTSSILF